MHIQDFFQNFLKLFLVGLHGDCTISLIAQDMSPHPGSRGARVRPRARCPARTPERNLTARPPYCAAAPFPAPFVSARLLFQLQNARLNFLAPA